MHAASVPEQLRSRCYCPSCGGELTCAETADPLAICLACPSDHRFFVMPEGPLAVETAKAASAHFPELEHQEPEQVAAFWLSDSVARSILNEQLAELLRVILEARSTSNSLPLSYCPICGGGLSEYEQPDIWVRGLRCSHGHSWAERGGRLGSVLGSTGFALRAEPSESVVRQLVSGWLKGNPHLDTNLHRSVRQVLAASIFGRGAA